MSADDKRENSKKDKSEAPKSLGLFSSLKQEPDEEESQELLKKSERSKDALTPA